MTQILSQNDLQAADIILTAGQDNASLLIRTLTSSKFSHALLYDNDGFVIEAIPTGVIRRPLKDAIAHKSEAKVYRYKELSKEQAAVILTYARGLAKSAHKYDWIGAFAAGVKKNPALGIGIVGLKGYIIIMVGGLNNSENFFCSELVIEAYKQANIPIITGRLSSNTPENIVSAVSHDILQYVGALM